MKLLPKQNKAVYYLKDSTTTELLFGGAAGGGKSALGCLWLIENCQKYPGSRWLMGRAKLKTLKETTLNTFFDLTQDLGISDQFTYNGQTNVIAFTNGSEIILKDLFLYPSDPHFDSLGSLEITGAFIDECNQIVYKAWQVVKSRIRYRLNEFDLTPKLLGTCNPAKNWVYKKFYITDKNNSMPDYKMFIQSLPKDNPHLPKSYIKSLLELDEISKKRLHDGDWEYDDDKATLISYGAIMDYWNGQHIKPEGEKYLTIDVARKGKDKTVYRVWHGWVCTHRYELAISTITQVNDKARLIQAEHQIQNSKTIADEDGVGGGVVDGLQCVGFVNNSRPKKEQVGEFYVVPNYANLKSQCSILMAKKIEAREVVEMCQDADIIDIVSEEMQQVKLKDIDKDGKLSVIPKDKIKENIGRSPDDWDAVMMRMYFDLEQEFFVV